MSKNGLVVLTNADRILKHVIKHIFEAPKFAISPKSRTFAVLFFIVFRFKVNKDWSTGVLLFLFYSFFGNK